MIEQEFFFDCKERDRRARELRKAGHRVFCSTLRNQQTWDTGIASFGLPREQRPNFRIGSVYMLTIDGEERTMAYIMEGPGPCRAYPFWTVDLWRDYRHCETMFERHECDTKEDCDNLVKILLARGHKFAPEWADGNERVEE